MPSAGPRTFHSSRAFLVRAVDMGEADRRITLFTEGDGVVSLVGKSARKSRKRFGGSLQRYLLLDVSWTLVPNRMAVMEQAAIVASFWEIVEDWERVRHADHLLEVAVALFPQPGPKPRAFEALYSGMRALALGDSPTAVARRSEAAFLAISGWGPNLSACRKCGLADIGPFQFFPGEGSVYCGACKPPGGIPLSLGAVRTWRALQSSSPSVLSRIKISEVILKEMRDVMPRYLEWCIGKPLRSLSLGQEG
jgi:DNA repair protein RecO (recombination protein O)